MSSFVYFERPIHPNHFPEFKIPDESRELFLFSIEGGIQGVKESAIAQYLKDPEVQNIRLGYSKFPKKTVIKNLEDLLKIAAVMAEF